jgi:hypothetical protein
MATGDENRGRERPLTREERLAAALRANLRRRKAPAAPAGKVAESAEKPLESCNPRPKPDPGRSP